MQETEEVFTPVREEPGLSYWGDHPDWLITLTIHRDADVVDESNWRVITRDILDRFPDDAEIEHFDHWAVGWVEALVVRPGSEAEAAMREWADRLASYPVADDEDLIDLEQEYADREYEGRDDDDELG